MQMEVTKFKPPGDTADKFILRFDAGGLRKALKVRAAQNERTLNAEILYLIKRGLTAELQGAQQ
jgi:plasmid stability protein